MISAILLAAGQSTRMGKHNKLIKEINGIPLIKHSIKNILKSNIDELIIVTGHDNEKIKRLIDNDKKIKLIFNKNFRSGMASSIKSGLNYLNNKTEYFFICLADMPFIKPDIYNKIIESKIDKEIIVPTYNKKQGNPVLFSKSMKKDILNINGDVGAKEILKLNNDKLLNIEIDDECIFKDFNTLENFNF